MPTSASWKAINRWLFHFPNHYDPSKPDLLYLRGGVKSRIMANLANGAPVCVTVTLLDGLVYSRKAMNHSMNYRSVVLLGKARAITDRQEKLDLFDQMVHRYFRRPEPGNRRQPAPGEGPGRDRLG